MSGYPEVAEMVGPDATYELCPRAKIFRRDEGNVKDMKSMQYIMRYNSKSGLLIHVHICKCVTIYDSLRAICTCMVLVLLGEIESCMFIRGSKYFCQSNLGCTYTDTLLMMIVDYTNDPYSEDDPINAICSRGDLMKEPEAGGCYDTKVYTPLHTS